MLKVDGKLERGKGRKYKEFLKLRRSEVNERILVLMVTRFFTVRWL